MSSYANTLGQRRHLLLLTALLVSASIAIALIWAIGNDSAPVSDQVAPVSSPASGPDETARGSAAASAAGVVPEQSGPNETARGQSAAGAAGNGS